LYPYSEARFGAAQRHRSPMWEQLPSFFFEKNETVETQPSQPGFPLPRHVTRIFFHNIIYQAIDDIFTMPPPTLVRILCIIISQTFSP
jgi:hypothetical protein